MQVEINQAMLDALEPPARGRIELLDARVPGLTLRVTAGAVYSWTVRARLPDGRRVRPTLGKYPKLGLAAARRQARIVIGEINKGGDPTAAKRAKRETALAAAQAPTVALRFKQWQAAKEADWSERYAAEVKRLGVKVIIPKLGARALNSTTRADWVELVAGLRKRAPGTASWLYSVTSSFLNHAEAHGWVDANPLPRRGRNQIAPKVPARARVLSDDELVGIWRGSARLTAKTRVFARILILTAARVSEAAGIAAGEVSFVAETWTLPAARTKNRLPLTVPLHPLLQAELRAVWPDEHIGAGYRLLGAIKGSGFTAPSKTKVRVDEMSGVTGWRWHDLRRTARTGMARLGIDPRAAEAALNHVSDRSQLQRVYDRHPYRDEAIAALQAWQAYVVRLVAAADTAAA